MKFIDSVITQITAWAEAGAKELDAAANKVKDKANELKAKKSTACDWVSKVRRACDHSNSLHSDPLPIFLQCKAAQEAVKCGRKQVHLHRRSEAWEDSYFEPPAIQQKPRKLELRSQSREDSYREPIVTEPEQPRQRRSESFEDSYFESAVIQPGPMAEHGMVEARRLIRRWGAIGRWAKKAVDTVGNAAAEVARKAREVAEAAARKARELAEEVARRTREAYEAAKRKAAELAERVRWVFERHQSWTDVVADLPIDMR